MKVFFVLDSVVGNNGHCEGRAVYEDGTLICKRRSTKLSWLRFDLRQHLRTHNINDEVVDMLDNGMS